MIVAGRRRTHPERLSAANDRVDGAAVALLATVSEVAVLSATVLCEVTATPANRAPLVLSVTLVPLT